MEEITVTTSALLLSLYSFTMKNVDEGKMLQF